MRCFCAHVRFQEAALYVSSGTQGNLISVLVHCNQRGDCVATKVTCPTRGDARLAGSEVILGHLSHIHLFEQGGISQLGGVHARTAHNLADGTMDVKEIESLIRARDDHAPTTRLIAIENTHNKCGGRVLTPEYTDSVGESVPRSQSDRRWFRGFRVHSCAGQEAQPQVPH